MGGAAGLPGVLNATGGLSAANDLVFISGSLRRDNNRFLSRWVDRSAFSAAAVVTATFGVTLKDRLVPLYREPEFVAVADRRLEISNFASLEDRSAMS